MYSPESFVKHKDLPNFSSIFGNLGNSWTNPLPNDLYIKNVPKSIFRGGNFVGNTGTGLQTFLTVNLPGRSLKSNDDLVHFRLGGGVGSNDDNKRVLVSYDGTTLLDTGLVDWDGFGYLVDCIIVRRSDVLVNIETTILLGNVNIDSGGGIASNGAKVFSVNANLLAVSDLDTTNTAFLLRGESATATNNNIFWNVGSVELTRS